MKEFFLVLFVAICIGAGGYVYNDIVDKPSDEANEKRGIVGHSISRKIALLYYLFLIFAPVPAVLSLCMELDSNYYMIGYAVLILALLVYNVLLKKLPLIGNVTVALLCGFAVALPFLIEIQAMSQLNEKAPELYSRALYLVVAFTFFSFMANLIRELVKDVEDMHGDQQANYKTFPIVYGLPNTRNLLIIFEFLLLIFLGYWVVQLKVDNLILLLVICLTMVPLSYLIYKTWVFEKVEDFGKLSQYFKWYFLSGIFALIFASGL